MATKKELSPWAKGAQATRTEINAAVKAGRIELPTGAKVSVIADSFSMGSSIDVRVKGAPESWVWASTGDRPGDWVLSDAARKLGRKLTAILAKHNGHSWGGVTVDGISLGTVAKAGWTPGQD